MPSANVWEAGFRAAVKASTPPGWTVTPHKSQVRLQVRETGAPGTPPRNQSTVIPYRWEAAAQADALLRIRVISQLYDGSLADAAQQAEGRSSHAVMDWPSAVAAYRHQRIEIQAVTSAATWAKKYAPVLSDSVAAMASRRPPADAQTLFDLVLSRWQPGSRSRQIARQSLAGFLTYAVARHGFGRAWQPSPAVREARIPKRDGWPLSDAQILRLIDALPTTHAGERWRFALQLLATYGLRPEELRHLHPSDGGITCSYRKAAGPGRRTSPRRLHPLLIRDLEGSPVDWRLPQRLAVGEALPPLGQPGKGGEALRTYLMRQPMWRSLEGEVAAAGGTLTGYCFRHRYAKGSHAAGLPFAQVATAMGHTIEVHLAAYARFQPDAVGVAYEMANQSTAESGITAALRVR
ncbi:hypothetical protein [Synechococcus sp. J7-Johnson]|uniref:hypothetical protein n=1 Tax=Synechococcus sp. J7-Johnson TaxID=2823737 RepID=UPI0020CF65C9|nr:hypothetical protein [Synechococcus sp. J7-Johnson]